ncbi:Gp138 family membrane-puncturing spike protein [Paenibacillus sp. FSL W8-0194]|uniref:Gp138 family membrane-puncturing spike protein n=1 Tax=Paenibacillus sp. FSL W8-0194 TaxID=2921711 RepID=UPI0030D92760
MRTDPAGSMSTIFESFKAKIFSDLHVGFLCKVINFDSGKCAADVQPLIRTTSDMPAIIQGAQVLAHRLSVNGGEPQVYKPLLKQGDVVFVVCADREIKNALNGSVAAASTGRQHDVNDAVVLGVLGCNLSS